MQEEKDKDEREKDGPPLWSRVSQGHMQAGERRTGSEDEKHDTVSYGNRIIIMVATRSRGRRSVGYICQVAATKNALELNRNPGRNRAFYDTEQYQKAEQN